MSVHSLNRSGFNLDISGVVGFFGGDVAVQAMTTLHVYEGHKMLGWYNMPGSYEIAKRYGQLAKSKLWGGLHPGVNVDPAALFELDGRDGPAFRGVHSGTIMSKTGHAAHLLLEECQSVPDPIRIQGRRDPSVPVSIVRLHSVPAEVIAPRILHKFSTLLALIPILATAGTAAACAVFADWFCFAMIVLGMLSGGVSSFVIGRGTLTFTHPKPASGVPPGDGLLYGGSETAVLLGAEGAVSAVTRGALALQFADERQFHAIRLCALLLAFQSVAQLIFVAQGTLFGQLMFLASLLVSWAYNSYLASLNRREAQRRILVERVLGGPHITRFLLPTRTAMAVFVLAILAKQGADAEALQSVLASLVPNDTPVWRAWRDAIRPMVRDPVLVQTPSVPAAVSEPMSADDRRLLADLISDAVAGRQAFMSLGQSESRSTSIESGSIPSQRAMLRRDAPGKVAAGSV